VPAQTVADDSAKRTPSADVVLLKRQYRAGEALIYHMKARNENWHYEARATGMVKKDSDGKYSEEFAWSNLISNGGEIPLPPASANFRQTLSLDPDRPPSVPPLNQVSPMLIGPITDLLTFYTDLWLAMRAGSLTHAGDHFYSKIGTPASWADGTRVVLGQDSIDFDVTLSDVNGAKQTATVTVRHVVPEHPQVTLPADWMRAPVVDGANNWVEVTKISEAKYVAEVGKETFEVAINVDLADGKILQATLDNLVVTQKRECTDAALTACGAPSKHDIRRQIELTLEH
jgi:hypothetical protein